jgi:hypothetical protein
MISNCRPRALVHLGLPVSFIAKALGNLIEGHVLNMNKMNGDVS